MLPSHSPRIRYIYRAAKTSKKLPNTLANNVPVLYTTTSVSYPARVRSCYSTLAVGHNHDPPILSEVAGLIHLNNHFNFQYFFASLAVIDGICAANCFGSSGGSSSGTGGDKLSAVAVWLARLPLAPRSNTYCARSRDPYHAPCMERKRHALLKAPLRLSSTYKVDRSIDPRMPQK